MKINKDLTDAVMMLGFIILVLVGTSDYDNPTIKTILLATLSTTVIAAVICRIMEAKSNNEEKE